MIKNLRKAVDGLQEILSKDENRLKEGENDRIAMKKQLSQVAIASKTVKENKDNIANLEKRIGNAKGN